MISPSALPLVLRANALSSASCGALMIAFPGALGALTGLSPLVLRVVGFGLLPFAAFVLYVAREPRPGLVRVVSVMDFAWVAGSIALVALGELTAIGIALVAAIAAVVDLFGTLQVLAVRRPRRMLAES